MKRFLALAAVALALVACSPKPQAPTSEVSTVGMLTTEPKLAVDAKYEAEHFTCNKHAGKALAMDIYVKKADGFVKRISVVSMNGEKVDQREAALNEATGSVQAARYVRNSPGKNWIRYDPSIEAEERLANERFLAELSLTKEELAKCDEK